MELKHPGRAGEYTPRPGGFRAFVPAPLPPDPPIQMDEGTWALLSKADRALARLDGATDALPNPDLFVLMYVRREAVMSSQIEGTQASLDDLLEYEAKTTRSAKLPDVKEVANYVNAMDYGLERLKDFPVSLRLVREIHERLLAGVRGAEKTPGEFRTRQNWIGSEHCSINEATFVPPPIDEMHVALGDLEKFIHVRDKMPVLIQLGLIHAQFETIHPFLDGNGRTGRLLVTLLLCEREILARPLLYLSIFLKQHRAEYYDRLQAVRDHGQWEEWLEFFLRGVIAVASDATNTARSILRLREDHRELVLAQGKMTGRTLMLLDKLYFSPYVSVETVQEDLKWSYSSVNSVISGLCELGILREITGKQRGRIFRYDHYLSLFQEGKIG